MLQCLFVSAHPVGNCQLVLGARSAVLLDCGVPFCAPETAETIKARLGHRTLDAIILSHSHYDHTAGLPWLRRAFPETPVCAHPYALEVFKKPNALATIQKMCQNARRIYGEGFSGDSLNNAELQGIMPLADGQEFPFDDGVCRVIFTPGHTKDSLSVDWPAQGVAWLCETLGVTRPDGGIQPCFLSGYAATLDSFDRVAALGARRFFLSHTAAPLSASESAGYLAASRAVVTESAELIRRLFAEGLDAQDIFTAYAKRYWDERYRSDWPYEAFSINTVAAIRTVLRELCGQRL